MIFEGENIDGLGFNRKLTLSDWRFSATAIGLIQFFDFHKLSYRREKRALYYNYEDIVKTEDDEKYLLFAENHFSEFFHHIEVEQRLKFDVTEENSKAVNEKFSANTIMKKVFKGIKYNGENKNEIQNLIDENRLVLIKETFVNGKKLYRKFINPSMFRKPKAEVCRLLGYYLDTGRKLKSLGFGFDKKARSYEDAEEFDFIPFAFSKGMEAIFIHNNMDIQSLEQSFHWMNGKLENLDEWRGRFYNYIKGEEYLEYDVEIIKKGMENDDDKNEYYSNLFLRETAIDIFKELSTRNDKEYLFKGMKSFIKINENYYINIMNEVTDSIINLCDIDRFIDVLLKKGGQSFVATMLIRINVVIYSHLSRLGEDMDKEKYLASSIKTAMSLVAKLKNSGNENKIKTYRHKLTAALVANDSDRFIEIMLQLSSYTETPFVFMHALIADFDHNKNLAYAFVNALIENDYKSEN